MAGLTCARLVHRLVALLASLFGSSVWCLLYPSVLLVNLLVNKRSPVQKPRASWENTSEEYCWVPG